MLRIRSHTVIVMVILLKASMHAQSDSSMVSSSNDNVADEEMDFTIVEEMPEFPGGQQALFAYLGSNISYPDEAIRKGVEGVVYVAFTVEKDGSVNDVDIVRGIGAGCDEEVVRLVRSMPAWKPGTQKGTPVSVRYNMPVKFTLRGGKKKRSKKA